MEVNLYSSGREYFLTDGVEQPFNTNKWQIKEVKWAFYILVKLVEVSLKEIFQHFNSI